MSQGEGPLHVPLTSRPGLRVTFRLDGSEHSSNTCPHRNGATDQGKGTAWFFPVDPHQIPVCPLLSGDRVRKKTMAQGRRGKTRRWREERKGERGDCSQLGRTEGGPSHKCSLLPPAQTAMSPATKSQRAAGRAKDTWLGIQGQRFTREFCHQPCEPRQVT